MLTLHPKPCELPRNYNIASLVHTPSSPKYHLSHTSWNFHLTSGYILSSTYPSFAHTKTLPQSNIEPTQFPPPQQSPSMITLSMKSNIFSITKCVTAVKNS